jgi:hypothetical protein
VSYEVTGRNKWRGLETPTALPDTKVRFAVGTDLNRERPGDTHPDIAARKHQCVLRTPSHLVGAMAVHVVTTSLETGSARAASVQHGLPLAGGCDTLKFAAEVDRKEISHESWERRVHASPLA